jgi:hypothetical protein
MEEQLRVLVALGLVLILLLLRLDARRFGVAEYATRDEYGDMPPLLPRLAWYVVGVILVVAVYVVFPGDPTSELGLTTGDRTAAVLMGLGAGVIGIAQAVALAYGRFGGLRPPGWRAYPGGIVNSLGTALVDEATFRGIVLGLLLATGIGPIPSVVIQALAYVLATRVGRSGGSLYPVLLDLVIGLVGGWLTIVTGGIAAAFIFDALTRLGVFVATGSPDAQVPPEWVDDESEVPPGWEWVDEDASGQWTPAAWPADAPAAPTALGTATAAWVYAPPSGAYQSAASATPAAPPPAGPPPADGDLDDFDASLP